MNKFRTPQEEIAYLRERIKEKNKELETPENRFEHNRLARREIDRYAEIYPSDILYATVIIPDHDATKMAKQLSSEDSDMQIDFLLTILPERGIRNTLSIVEKMDNPGLENDLHKILAEYIAEGFPTKKAAFERGPHSTRTWSVRSMYLYEIQPSGKDIYTALIENLSGLLSSELGANTFSFEIAMPQGIHSPHFYIAIQSDDKDSFEIRAPGIFSNAHIIELREDYNIFNATGVHAAAYAESYEITVPELLSCCLTEIGTAFSKMKKAWRGRSFADYLTRKTTN